PALSRLAPYATLSRSPAESGDDAVAFTLVLHLEHHALVRLVGSVLTFGDDAIESGALESLKPIRGSFSVASRGRDVKRRLRILRSEEHTSELQSPDHL